MPVVAHVVERGAGQHHDVLELYRGDVMNGLALSGQGFKRGVDDVLPSSGALGATGSRLILAGTIGFDAVSTAEVVSGVFCPT